ncbi:MAG TPA: glycosyltransferase family 39 protein [Lacunisphaera sp.]
MISLNSAAFPFLLLVGLVAPGWLLGKCLGTAGGPIGAFLGSAALLLNLVLMLDGLNLALTASNIATGLTLICAIFAVATKFHGRPAAPSVPDIRLLLRTHDHRWLLLFPVLGLAAIVIRAALDPLSGFDTFFRWDFLARQMLTQGNLHFYPAITAEDLKHYAWCDGIAPLISSLYFWSYLSLGKAVEWATAPVVVGQAILLFWAVYNLATHRDGSGAGCAALALLATSPVLLWGVAMGQETGLTALSLVAMFLFIERHRSNPQNHWLVWAGIAAGTGALAREYGLIYICLGGLTLSGGEISRRQWVEFLATATLVALPWYLRNWFKTGNPLYSHALGGLFPSNPIQDEYAQTIKNLIGLGTPSAGAAVLATLVGTLAGVPLLLGIADVLNFNRRRVSWLVAIVAMIALWLWSINETSGGAIYSLRVLTPAIALGAAAGGSLLARTLKSKMRWIPALLLIPLVVDAAQRSLFMPFDHTVLWWNRPMFAWERFRDNSAHWNHHPHWANIANAADSFPVLVSDPYSFTILTRLGAQPISLYSPSVRFIFEHSAQLSPAMDRLRKEKIRFILLSNEPITQSQLLQHAFFKALSETPPTMPTPMFSLYDLYSDRFLKPSFHGQ